MPGKPEPWITAEQAAEIMTRTSGHEISAAYVRRLSNTGKIETKPIDKRTKLYLRSDVEGYQVRQRGAK